MKFGKEKERADILLLIFFSVIFQALNVWLAIRAGFWSRPGEVGNAIFFFCSHLALRDLNKKKPIQRLFLLSTLGQDHLAPLDSSVPHKSDICWL